MIIILRKVIFTSPSGKIANIVKAVNFVNSQAVVVLFILEYPVVSPQKQELNALDHDVIGYGVTRRVRCTISLINNYRVFLLENNKNI